MFLPRWLPAGFLCFAIGLARAELPPVEPNPKLVDDLPPAKPALDDWPWWRGAARDNKSPDTRPPLRWSQTNNIAWKTPVPGRGHASPTIWGKRVFIATADESAQIQSLLCFDRKTGDPLWQTEVHQGGFLKKHENNSHASATPACDGER